MNEGFPIGLPTLVEISTGDNVRAAWEKSKKTTKRWKTRFGTMEKWLGSGPLRTICECLQHWS